MEDRREEQSNGPPISPSAHRRGPSSSGLLSKLPFMRPATENPGSVFEDEEPQNEQPSDQQGGGSLAVPGRSFAIATQQQKTRRRRGSLRKVALLGRGAQRDRRDGKSLTIDTESPAGPSSGTSPSVDGGAMQETDSLEFSSSDITPRPSMDARTSQTSLTTSSISSSGIISPPGREVEPANSYNSTTDEEEMLHIPRGPVPTRTGMSMSSGSESYFTNMGTQPRSRSLQQNKSPLSYSGLSKSQLPPPDSDWDYSETEWWGWVVLGVTWFVFVIGMGSCLGVWSWAWDVGKTPYAPPELEDDPTLPIVGYYPALMILTCVMAWVWVVVAWVGMKYFRHAKISGD